MNDITHQQVSQQLQAFVVNNFGLGAQDNIKVTDRLFEEGIVDSLGLLRIVEFIEDQFDITVQESDVTLDTFGSVEQISNYVITLMTD